jgi:mRNA interferase MazF
VMFHRGDIVLVFSPFASGVGGSRRPALVVQADAYNARIRNTLVAQITTNLRYALDPACLPIQVATPEGRQTGLLHNCLISCINLATITEDRINRVIGRLSDDMMHKIDQCLIAALGIDTRRS